jgi:hypothetical protein
VVEPEAGRGVWDLDGDSEETEAEEDADADAEGEEGVMIIGLVGSMSSALIEPAARLLALRGALWMKGQAVW